MHTECFLDNIYLPFLLEILVGFLLYHCDRLVFVRGADAVMSSLHVLLFTSFEQVPGGWC